MLNPNAAQWVAALRSGEYEQCKMQLTYNGKFCCLGVGALLAEKAGVITDAEWIHNCYLPEKVVKWLGLRTEQGSYGQEEFLSSDNDNSRKTFSEIADIIESEPEGLFEKGGAA
jgi:hypothetical protein